MPLFSCTALQALPSLLKAAPISASFCWGCEKALSITQRAKPVPEAAGPFLLQATVMPPLHSTKPRANLLLLQELQAGLILLQNHLKLDKRLGRKGQ